MLSIGDFSRISKVTSNTLRYYDEINLIKPVHVNSENGYRYYNVSQLETMLLINRLKGYTFSLEEIAEILKDPQQPELILMLKQKKEALKEKIAGLNHTMTLLENDILNLERGIYIMSYLDNIEVKLIETKPLNILYVRERMNIYDYSKYLEKLHKIISDNNLTIAGAPMTIFHHEGNEFDPMDYDNEIAVPIKEAVDGTRVIPGSLCVMATLKGPYSELAAVYTKMKQWTEKENYTALDTAYEIYITNPFETPENENVTEIYLPVIAKKL